MRILSRDEFMLLPSGTVYMKEWGESFQGPSIKGDTIYGDTGEPIDWFYTDLYCVDKEEIDSSDESNVTVLWGQSRDACFDDALFLILASNMLAFAKSFDTADNGRRTVRPVIDEFSWDSGS